MLKIHREEPPVRQDKVFVDLTQYPQTITIRSSFNMTNREVNNLFGSKRGRKQLYKVKLNETHWWVLERKDNS